MKNAGEGVEDDRSSYFSGQLLFNILLRYGYNFCSASFFSKWKSSFKNAVVLDNRSSFTGKKSLFLVEQTLTWINFMI